MGDPTKCPVCEASPFPGKTHDAYPGGWSKCEACGGNGRNNLYLAQLQESAAQFGRKIVAEKGSDFVRGYEECERIFFGDNDATPVADIDPTKVVNPYPEGSDAHEGFEEAYYDFTQK